MTKINDIITKYYDTILKLLDTSLKLKSTFAQGHFSGWNWFVGLMKMNEKCLKNSGENLYTDNLKKCNIMIELLLHMVQ